MFGELVGDRKVFCKMGKRRRTPRPEKPPTDYYRDAPMSTDVAGVGSCGVRVKPRLAAFFFKWKQEPGHSLGSCFEKVLRP